MPLEHPITPFHVLHPQNCWPLHPPNDLTIDISGEILKDDHGCCSEYNCRRTLTNNCSRHVCPASVRQAMCAAVITFPELSKAELVDASLMTDSYKEKYYKCVSLCYKFVTFWDYTVKCACDSLPSLGVNIEILKARDCGNDLLNRVGYLRSRFLSCAFDQALTPKYKNRYLEIHLLYKI